jgi:hypothetical protein
VTDSPLASDALVVAIDLCGEESGPRAVFPEGPCAYCREAVQMVNGRFRSLYNGELHTCPLYITKPLGRRYQRGVFILLDSAK